MEVVLLRDPWGVPHVFAPTDEAAMYGLGWAAAEDRLFQMLYTRLIARGRVAEHFGPGFVPGAGDVNVAHDLSTRQFGWERRAVQAAAALDPETYGLLEAYAQGVSEYMASPDADLNPLIAQHGIPLEDWQVEDCIVVWWRFANLFGGNGTEEVSILRTWESLLDTMAFDDAYDELIGGAVCDDAAAVVQQADVPVVTQQAMADYVQAKGLDAPGHCPLPPLSAPKFSNVWAVSGARTHAGRSVLIGDPRAVVCWPNQYYEWSVEGATFSARGVGVAGSPIVVAGSTANAAWSPTALGLDQADMFSLTTDPVGHPGQYLLDGEWRAFEVDEVETVHVLGAASQQLHYRETVFGPVVTALIQQALPGEEFAARRVPFHDAARDPTVAAFRMLRAGDLDEFYSALADWSFPSMNIVFADAGGRIGFAVTGDVPVRPGGLVLAGVIPQDGSSSASNWLEVLPHGLEPHVLDPGAGALWSANHMPIGSWYPIPIRFGSGSVGDTQRSRRLAELLGALGAQVDPSEVEALRFDTVNTARRDMVELGLWLRDAQTSYALSADAVSALVELEPWWLEGARMDSALPGTALAWHMKLAFHGGDADPELHELYGGGENGLSLLLKSTLDKIHAALPLSQAEAALVDGVLAQAWVQASAIGPSSAWSAWYQQNVLTFELENWKTPEGLPAPAGSAASLSIGPVSSTDAAALCATQEQDYTQVVEPGAGPMARSLLPPGQSEHPGLHELDQYIHWTSNTTKPAPRTLAEVKASGPFTKVVLRFDAPVQ